MPSHEVDNIGSPEPDRVNVEAQGAKIETEFQKYMTDADPITMMFYSALAGYRIIYITKRTYVLGVEQKSVEEKIEIDSDARICNEKGANYVISNVKPLISPLVATSNLDAMEIYNLWKGKVQAVRIGLLNSYFLEDNPYELKLYRLSEITTMLISLYTITSKAKGGFTLTKLADSFITSVIQRQGGQVSHQESLKDKIVKGLGGG